jgi:hypothetical protein
LGGAADNFDQIYHVYHAYITPGKDNQGIFRRIEVCGAARSRQRTVNPFPGESPRKRALTDIPLAFFPFFGYGVLYYCKKESWYDKET